MPSTPYVFFRSGIEGNLARILYRIYPEFILGVILERQNDIFLIFMMGSS
jgi:hypothetical protein